MGQHNSFMLLFMHPLQSAGQDSLHHCTQGETDSSIHLCTADLRKKGEIKIKRLLCPVALFLNVPGGGGEYIEVKSYLIPVLRQLEEDGCISCLHLA